jgi:hypothetical protein
VLVLLLWLLFWVNLSDWCLGMADELAAAADVDEEEKDAAAAAAAVVTAACMCVIAAAVACGPLSECAAHIAL